MVVGGAVEVTTGAEDVGVEVLVACGWPQPGARTRTIRPSVASRATNETLLFNSLTPDPEFPRLANALGYVIYHPLLY
jgi:hypothetical protein